MAVVPIYSDFGAQENKVSRCFHCFPIYLPWSDTPPQKSHLIFFPVPLPFPQFISVVPLTPQALCTPAFLFMPSPLPEMFFLSCLLSAWRSPPSSLIFKYLIFKGNLLHEVFQIHPNPQELITASFVLPLTGTCPSVLHYTWNFVSCLYMFRLPWCLRW